MQIFAFSKSFALKGNCAQFPRIAGLRLASFTKHFGVGFVLTLRLFGRRVLMPREKIATAAAPSQAPNAR
jgi:hypothetical protein